MLVGVASEDEESVMQRVIVRYKLKPGRAQENEQYIQQVFDELNSTAPTGLRYCSFKLDDERWFMHIAFIDTDDGSNPLTSLKAFQAFVAEIGERCEIPPEASGATLIGGYRMFD
jgi:hypothetical protein